MVAPQAYFGGACLGFGWMRSIHTPFLFSGTRAIQQHAAQSVTQPPAAQTICKTPSLRRITHQSNMSCDSNEIWWIGLLMGAQEIILLTCLFQLSLPVLAKRGGTDLIRLSPGLTLSATARYAPYSPKPMTSREVARALEFNLTFARSCGIWLNPLESTMCKLGAL